MFVNYVIIQGVTNPPVVWVSGGTLTSAPPPPPWPTTARSARTRATREGRSISGAGGRWMEDGDIVLQGRSSPMILVTVMTLSSMQLLETVIGYWLNRVDYKFSINLLITRYIQCRGNRPVVTSCDGLHFDYILRSCTFPKDARCIGHNNEN